MQRMGRAIVEAILPILENHSKDKDLSRPLRNSDLLLQYCMASYTQGDEQAQMTDAQTRVPQPFPIPEHNLAKWKELWEAERERRSTLSTMTLEDSSAIPNSAEGKSRNDDGETNEEWHKWDNGVPASYFEEAREDEKSVQDMLHQELTKTAPPVNVSQKIRANYLVIT